MRSGPVVVVVQIALLGCVSSRPQPLEQTVTLQQTLEQTAAEVVAGATTERERAQRIFRFVRDEIEFGFTPRFDAADPLYTLEAGRGHCNPQTELLVALMRAAGLEARQRFVTITPEVLDGLFPKRAPAPKELNHSYAEVRLDDRWVRIDGYLVDPALFRAGLERLREEERSAGYGVSAGACNEWDGRSDCMAQFTSPEMVLREHDPIEPARAFYASEDYTQRLGGIGGFFYRRFGVPAMNERLDEVRSGDWEPRPAVAADQAP